jgi:hypothetical protein
MWYISIFDAKENMTRKDIYRERATWIRKGKDRLFQKKCKTIKRYEVVGTSPLKIFFVIETNDPTALTMLTNHFGDAWDSITFPIVQRDISEALKEDSAVKGG